MSLMPSVRTLGFRGQQFKIVAYDSHQHPTHYTFDDESSVRELFWHIKPGEVVFDIGAAYGSYTITALLQGASHVYSFSPQPAPINEISEKEILEQSVALNGMTSRSRVYDFGFYSRNGYINTRTLEFNEQIPGEQNGDIIRVQRLDEFVEQQSIDRIDIMKLDVEGAELDVLFGATYTLNKYRPRILIENHKFIDQTIEHKVRQFLVSNSYVEVQTVPYHSVSHSLYIHE